MMIRTLLLLLIAGTIAARASEPITAPQVGASASVSQPHVTAELIPETTSVQPGQPFDVALHLHSDPGWHTYWINPGDAGLATTIKWTLPPGFMAGPIEWPTPEKHNMGPLITYGYEGDVYLLTTITPPKLDLPQHFDVKAHAEWLVCQEECIPGHADLTLTLDSGLLNLRLPAENKDLFDQARARLPVPNTRWDVKAAYQKAGTDIVTMLPIAADALASIFHDKADTDVLTLALCSKAKPGTLPGELTFFPEQGNVLSTQGRSTSMSFGVAGHEQSFVVIPLQQNGEKPNKLSGVIVDKQVFGGTKSAYIESVYIPEFPVTSEVAVAGSATVPPSGGPATGSGPGTEGTASSTSLGMTKPSQGPATATSETDSVARRSTATAKVQPWLIGVLGAAFLGGLILNLMPCVLPVLSLKVFSLMKHAGENPRGAWKQGAAFMAGVVISFWILAGLLLALRAAGNQLGWGFQMQSPGFVLALIFLFFLLALNLFGVFELGGSLVGLDAKATSHVSGLTSSFLNGALATLAATPCTAPFMGSALGFAAQQPAAISLLIFTFLALGMAFPYFLLTLFPGALRFVPKPGAWMETFKQFMGFLLMATVIFLIYVFGALVGESQIYQLLLGLLLAAMGAWLYGNRQRSLTARWPSGLFVFVFLMMGLGCGLDASMGPTGPHGSDEKVAESDGWQPWSPAAVDAALAQGRPVFVDFTAAWCLSCKVNERVALDTDAVRQAFAQKNVVLLKADWTQADPAISAALRQYNRDGVPLYLLYSPKNKDAPQVLPEVLTPGIVLEALQGL